MDGWNPGHRNRRHRRDPYRKREIMLRKSIILALSSHESVRLFGFLVISFSVTQIVLLGHPSLAPVTLLSSVEPEIDYSERPYSSHIIVSEKNNLLFCPVPKAANTNWKYLIRKWEGMKDYADLTRAHLPHRSGLRYLSDYSAREARAIVTGTRFFKFAFVRHPYRRALSAYMDKFRNTDPDYVRREYRVFLAALLGWRRARAVDVNVAPRPSFEDFVDALVATPRKEMNSHWMPQTMLCGFDEMRYDFVGRMEQLGADAAFVFRALNRTDEHFPSHEEIGFPPSGASSSLADKVFTLDLMRKVRSIYAEDFRVLGYPEA